MTIINTEPQGYLLILTYIDGNGETKVAYERCKFLEEATASAGTWHGTYIVISARLYELGKEIKL